MFNFVIDIIIWVIPKENHRGILGEKKFGKDLEKKICRSSSEGNLFSWYSIEILWILGFFYKKNYFLFLYLYLSQVKEVLEKSCKNF